MTRPLVSMTWASGGIGTSEAGPTRTMRSPSMRMAAR